jgi:hypothetical protein
MNITWIDNRQQKPPPPERPYKVYLVWVVQQVENATGTTRLLQFSRDSNDWLSPGFGPSGRPEVVTHWSDALDVLGSPEPKPWGPRGTGASS